MKKMILGTGEGVKRLSEALIEHASWFDGKPHLTPSEEEALEWAKEFRQQSCRNAPERSYE